jgi:hypothetical protein
MLTQKYCPRFFQIQTAKISVNYNDAHFVSPSTLSFRLNVHFAYSLRLAGFLLGLHFGHEVPPKRRLLGVIPRYSN